MAKSRLDPESQKIWDDLRKSGDLLGHDLMAFIVSVAKHGSKNPHMTCCRSAKEIFGVGGDIEVSTSDGLLRLVFDYCPECGKKLQEGK
jgi:hypothetical protein